MQKKLWLHPFLYRYPKCLRSTKESGSRQFVYIWLSFSNRKYYSRYSILGTRYILETLREHENHAYSGCILLRTVFCSHCNKGKQIYFLHFYIPNFGIPKCTALVELTVEEIKINGRIVCLFLGRTSMDACRQRQLAKKSCPTHYSVLLIGTPPHGWGIRFEMYA